MKFFTPWYFWVFLWTTLLTWTTSNLHKALYTSHGFGNNPYFMPLSKGQFKHLSLLHHGALLYWLLITISLVKLIYINEIFTFLFASPMRLMAPGRSPSTMAVLAANNDFFLPCFSRGNWMGVPLEELSTIKVHHLAKLLLTWKHHCVGEVMKTPYTFCTPTLMSPKKNSILFNIK